MMPSPTPLQELGQITQGVTLSRRDRKEEGSTYHIITIKDLENLYVKEAQEKAQLAASEKIEKCRLREGDVVIAIRGAPLKSSVITAAAAGSISNQNTVFFRPNSKEDIDPLYLAVLLRSTYFEPLLTSELQRSTTTLPAINVANVRALIIPRPDLNTQKEIAELFLDAEEFKQVMLAKINARQNIAEFGLLHALEDKIWKP